MYWAESPPAVKNKGRLYPLNQVLSMFFPAEYNRYVVENNIIR
jgi:hypothetical protein